MHPRDEYVLSTKVGRLLRPGAPDGPDGFVRHRADEVPRFDFSADGVRRSLDESLERLGVDRVDVVLIHDPDAHLEQAITEAAPALDSAPRRGRGPRDRLRHELRRAAAARPSSAATST